MPAFHAPKIEVGIKHLPLNTRIYGPSDEVSLHGNLWTPSAWFEEEKTVSRRWVCGLLQALYPSFRLQQPSPPRSNWMYISFNRSNLLHLINAPNPVCQAMNKVQRTQFLESSFEIKFRGYPWKAGGTETVQT
ncbi:predicted protein [Histoplasma capsulatum G186AR]|uniref:Uncharacterized protein n=1 Tax=Ajellomyces capsulatus (strain G186AR / H82 / ATCC MYA-2454 / RMSCC 2432) TaxID=447093 RepID=C0NWX4_AJECG|nr:uncharacterized protein HCBG_07966 [Histoplasma capsulatum G186AR]EEH03840.1 predicted protein [Histoplasma capsulatum G186AR]